MLDLLKNRVSEELTSFVTYRMTRVQNRLNAQAVDILKKNANLGLTDWRVISLIEYFEETSASQIAASAEMDKGQISRTIKKLQRAGLVTVEVSKLDHRKTMLRLSQVGRELHNMILPIMKDRQRSLTESLSQEEIETFFQVLDKLEAAADFRA